MLSANKVIIKFLHEVPTIQLIFLRALFILMVTYPILCRKKIQIFSPHWKILLLRGMFGTLGMILLFYVVQHTAMATSVSLFYLTPVFTVILARFIVHEKMPSKKWPWFILCLIGVAFVKNYSLDLSSWEFLLALGAALFAALAYNMIRLLKGKAPPLLVVFYLPLISIPVSIYPTFKNWVWLNTKQWILIFALCLLALAAQLTLTLAYQKTKAHYISHINYLGLPLGVLWGMVFFQEIPSYYAIMGVGFIFLGLLGSVLWGRKTTLPE